MGCAQIDATQALPPVDGGTEGGCLCGLFFWSTRGMRGWSCSLGRTLAEMRKTS